MGLNECQDLFDDAVMVSHIDGIRKPSLKRNGFFSLTANDSNTDFHCGLLVRPVEGDRCHRISREVTARLFPERFLVAFPQSHGDHASCQSLTWAAAASGRHPLVDVRSKEELELNCRFNRFDARLGARIIGLSSRGTRDADGAVRRAATFDKYATTNRQHTGNATKAAQGPAWLSFGRKR
jgi:hypothetical protein